MQCSDMKQGPAKRNNTVLVECLRQRQLSATDWIEALLPPTVDLWAWVDFRRQLEALPQLPGWPGSFDWPIPPRGHRRIAQATGLLSLS